MKKLLNVCITNLLYWIFIFVWFFGSYKLVNAWTTTWSWTPDSNLYSSNWDVVTDQKWNSLMKTAWTNDLSWLNSFTCTINKTASVTKSRETITWDDSNCSGSWLVPVNFDNCMIWIWKVDWSIAWMANNLYRCQKTSWAIYPAALASIILECNFLCRNN
jgi:hypothetical protein